MADPRRLLLVGALAAGLMSPVSLRAAEPASYSLSAKTGPARWSGTLTTGSPLGCQRPNLGCDTRVLVVTAPKGAWITITLDNDQAQLRVRHNGTFVGGAGGAGLLFDPTTHDERPEYSPRMVFRQMEAGSVRYSVTVGAKGASPASPFPYSVTAALAGHAFDRSVDCTVANLDGVTGTGTNRTRTVNVRLVGRPHDAPEIRSAGRTLAKIYARIGVPMNVSYDFFAWPAGQVDYPYVAVRRHYGGQRPSGVDVVDVVSDDFNGGNAACIGGIAYSEYAFSTSQLHYTFTENGEPPVAVRHVPAALLAAHEIGHLLGAQHNQVNCAEAIPQEAVRPAPDGWVGPCTLMGPLALQASEMFSTLERNTVRSYAEAFGSSG